MRAMGMEGALLAAPASDAADDEYEAVEGLTRADIECQRAHEAAAAKKTASDYQHIVWAYGVIWSLFAIYGVMLWRRGQRLSADVRTLTQRLDRA
ncbi:MAG: hypothetical protein KDK70_09250 [Myxococcales bacterium]|nr:hypothetical protein [Myxococcales bacterium]